MSKEITLAGWFVYIIESSDNSLYTGITTDVARRLQQHCTGKGGAKYFRGREPLRVVYQEDGHDRSSATRREAELKQLTREQKLQLIRQAGAA